MSKHAAASGDEEGPFIRADASREKRRRVWGKKFGTNRKEEVRKEK
jgi:hypothetical protein